MLLAQLQPVAVNELVFVVSTIAALVVTLILAFWVWMLIDCLNNELPETKEKRVWTIVIVCTGHAGAFMYNVGRRKKRIKELGQ